MKRNIIVIDEEKCNGCGLCIDACHEGALQLVDGKAKLVSGSYCDGLGDCLPECPTGAITIEEREAAPFDEEAVKRHLARKAAASPPPLACGCPGQQVKTIRPSTAATSAPSTPAEPVASQLRQWPCQLKLVPVNAPYFNDAHLLIAADCTAYTYANMHKEFMRNRITLIGCPKLDNVDYAEKLTAIIANNNLKSITVIRMEVPCCGGIVHAVQTALVNSGKMIPWQVVTIATDGTIVDS